MCFNMFCVADLLIYYHTKKDYQDDSNRNRSPADLDQVFHDIQNTTGYSVMGYVAVFYTCKPRLVSCMCFTTMEPCYSYRESQTRYY